MKTGEDVRISPQAVIRYPDLVTIADHVAIDEFTLITTELRLGSFVHIASHCSIVGGRRGCLVMEDFSCLAAGCRILCSSDLGGGYLIGAMVPEEYRNVTFSTIHIGKFAALSTNTIVLPGITIGEGAAVGAGSVVTRDLKPWGHYLGSPARWVTTRPKAEVLSRTEAFLRERDQHG